MWEERGHHQKPLGHELEPRMHTSAHTDTTHTDTHTLHTTQCPLRDGRAVFFEQVGSANKSIPAGGTASAKDPPLPAWRSGGYRSAGDVEAAFSLKSNGQCRRGSERDRDTT